jgi:hypothetical protein
MKAWAVVTADAVYSFRANAENAAERARAAGEKHVRVVEIDATTFFVSPQPAAAPAEPEKAS